MPDEGCWIDCPACDGNDPDCVRCDGLGEIWVETPEEDE